MYGLKKYSCAAGLPRVIRFTISSLYLITACEGHKADHEGRRGGYTSIITLSKDRTKTTDSLIAGAGKLMMLSHVAVCKPDISKLREIKFSFHTAGAEVILWERKQIRHCFPSHGHSFLPI